MEVEQAMIHHIEIARNPHGLKFWWVCACGKKGKQVYYRALAERAGNDHLRDVK